jgi:flavin-dependent dehydrogenase
MSEMVEADVGVVGGGPAGALAAMECRRRGLRVALWERSRFPRDKVCGEFLSPEAVPILQEEIPNALAAAAWIDRAEFVPRRGRRRALKLPQPGRGLSRWAMDQALWQAAQRAGVEALEAAAVVEVQRSWAGAGSGSGSAFEVITSAQAGRRRVRKLLVACGRWWKIDGLPSPLEEVKQNRSSSWMGVKAHFSGVAPRSAVELYFFPGGYCGLSPVENSLYNACALVHSGVTRARRNAAVQDMPEWLASVARHAALNERLRGAAQVSPTLTTAPVLPARRLAAWQDVLAAGDAAGFLDPFTGDGMAMALNGGRMAGRALAGACAARGVREKECGDWTGAYCRQLAAAGDTSYKVAHWIRRLVCAPEGVQRVASHLFPEWMGLRLLVATRWRSGLHAPAERL